MRKLVSVLMMGAFLVLTACGGSPKPATGGGQSGGQDGGSAAPKFTIDGKDVTQLYKDAQAEGKLFWYGGAYTNFDEFHKHFPGISQEVYRESTPVVLQKFVDEANANKTAADILMQGDPFTLAEQGKLGRLLEYEPGTAALYPHPAAFGKWVQPHAQTMVGPIYNEEMVKGDDEKKLQTDWKFLTDAKWKGKLAASTPESGGTSYGPIYMFLGEERAQFGPDFIKGLKGNLVKTAQSTVPPTQWVSAGEFAIHPWGYTIAAGDLLSKGAKIRQAFPPPTPVVYMGMAIPAKAPHPNAAKLYMEWAFSKEGQEAMVRICSAASARTDVKLDPYAKYSWYVPPTKTFVVQNLDAYLKGQKDPSGPAAEWHELLGIAK